MIEKHLTLDRSMAGPDHAASIEPDEFKAMMSAIRQVERAWGPAARPRRPLNARRPGRAQEHRSPRAHFGVSRSMLPI